eukprot:scaffold189836_cov33-Tisochrysis_lutea.AAC.2
MDLAKKATAASSVPCHSSRQYMRCTMRSGSALSIRMRCMSSGRGISAWISIPHSICFIRVATGWRTPMTRTPSMASRRAESRSVCDLATCRRTFPDPLAASAVSQSYKNGTSPKRLDHASSISRRRVRMLILRSRTSAWPYTLTASPSR